MTAGGPLTAEGAAGTSPRRWRRVAGVALLSLLLLAALVVEGRSVLLFHAVTPWSSPPRIHFCGRDYGPGGTVAASQAEQLEGAAPLQRVARGPLGQPIYAHPASAQQRARYGVPCAMVLYLRAGAGYRSYSLVGGP
jgi:hypothetical protein